MVAAGEDGLEHLARLADPTDPEQRINVPEGAGGERGLGPAKIVFGLVAIDVIAFAQLAGRKPISDINRTEASSASPPKAAVKAPTSAFQALSRTVL